MRMARSLLDQPSRIYQLIGSFYPCKINIYPINKGLLCPLELLVQGIINEVSKNPYRNFRIAIKAIIHLIPFL